MYSFQFQNQAQNETTPFGYNQFNLESKHTPALSPQFVPQWSDFPQKVECGSIRSECHKRLTNQGSRYNPITKVRPNHSVIEKRRRDRMKNLIQELASMVPMCKSVPVNRLDKFTVLKLAIQMICGTKQCSEKFNAAYQLPTITKYFKETLQRLQSSSFFAIISRNKGTVYFTSDSLANTLGILPSEMVGHSIYEFIQRTDVEKFQRNISYGCRNERQFVSDQFSLPNSKESFFHSTSIVNFSCNMAMGDKTEKDISQSPQIKTHANSRYLGRESPPSSPTEKRFAKVNIHGRFCCFPETLIVGLPGHLQSHSLDQAMMDKVECFVFTCSINGEGSEKADKTQVFSPFVLRLKKDGLIVSAQENVQDILGYPANSLTGSSFFDYVLIQDVEVAKLSVELSFSCQNSSPATLPNFRLLTADNKIANIYTKAMAINLSSDTTDCSQDFLILEITVENICSVKSKTMKTNKNKKITSSKVSQDIAMNNDVCRVPDCSEFSEEQENSENSMPWKICNNSQIKDFTEEFSYDGSLSPSTDNFCVSDNNLDSEQNLLDNFISSLTESNASQSMSVFDCFQYNTFDFPSFMYAH